MRSSSALRQPRTRSRDARGERHSAQPRVIFVGSFKPAADGTRGGQMQACSLLLNSPISQMIEWHLVDTTMRSLPPPRLHVRLADAIQRLIRMIYLLASKRPDAVLVFCSFKPLSLADKGLSCLVAKLFGTRVVLSLRSQVFEPRQCGRLFRWLVNLIVGCCDAVLCQSPAAATNLSRYESCRPTQLHLVPNWINPRDYPVRWSERRERLSNRVPLTLLFMGFLERFKGTHCLVEAAGILRQRGHRFRLVFCGGGSERSALERACLEKGIADLVEFRGWVADSAKAAAFREADLFVLPSHHEGFPNVLLEAMAWGLPLVTTPVGGIPHLVEGGKNGLFVEPGTALQLADALETLMLSRERLLEIGRYNRRTVLERHDIARLWPEVAAILAGTELPSQRSLAA